MGSGRPSSTPKPKSLNSWSKVLSIHSVSFSRKKKKLPSGNIFLFFSVNLSPFHYFFYTHAHTRICLGLQESGFVPRYNLPLAGFNPIHVNLNGLLMIVIMVFKVGAEIQRYLKKLTLALTLFLIFTIQQPLRLHFWHEFTFTIPLVLLTITLLIHLLGFDLGPTSTAPKWKPQLWEVSGLENTYPHPHHKP